MILSDSRILEEIEKGTIKITPYQRECLGSNSYDVHLGKTLATYREHILDAKKHNEIEYFDIPEEGFVLYPHIFYLGVTLEYTETLISSLMDTWVLVAVDTVGYERRRKIYILKSRGMPHAEEVRDFRVTSRGVQILPPSRSGKRSATARKRR